MRSIARSIFNWLFGCRHRELTRVFTLDQQTYRVCLSCGARIPFVDEPPHQVRERNPKAAGRSR
jgi:hypothetical protein